MEKFRVAFLFASLKFCRTVILHHLNLSWEDGKQGRNMGEKLDARFAFVSLLFTSTFFS